MSDLVKASAAMPAMPAGDVSISTLEQVLLQGDLSGMSMTERLEYYRATCQSLGLNPLTKPFEYLSLDNKLVLYARRDCTDQLRALRGISVQVVSREHHDGVYVVTARATTPDGRTDESTGAVPLVKEGGHWKTSQNGKRFFESDGSYHSLSPDARANAMMKAETKAKRRVTLSICGLGMLDESELDTVRGARPMDVEPLHGSQDAADSVAAAKLSAMKAGKQPSEADMDVPADVQTLWDGIRRGGPRYMSQIVTAYRDELRTVCGGDDVYDGIMAKWGMAGSKPDHLSGHKMAEYKGLILDLYRAVEAYREGASQ